MVPGGGEKERELILRSLENQSGTGSNNGFKKIERSLTRHLFHQNQCENQCNYLRTVQSNTNNEIIL